MGYALDSGAIATPIGSILVEAEGARLIAVRIGADGTRASSTLVDEALEQIEQWFAGERRDFTTALLPAASPRGEALRKAIRDIGYGDTASYGTLARSIGSGARAIGQACARNPFPLIIPCHRVLGSGGTLGAYSAGAGPATKRWLLDHEQGIAPLL